VVFPRTRKLREKILQISKYILVLLIVLGIPLAMTYFVKVVSEKENIFKYFTEGLWPEVFGITFTIIVLDRLAENRAKQERKRQLFQQLKYPSNDLAIFALMQIQQEEGLQEEALEYYRNKDGRIQLNNVQWSNGINLENANFEGSILWNADLRGAKMNNINLQGADLSNAYLRFVNLTNANLQGANLSSSKFEGAFLLGTNLQGADLSAANLEGVLLSQANLKGANLLLTNLKDAELLQLEYDEMTVLPDANYIISDNHNVLRDEHGKFMYDKYWSPETDMTRYTDPEHPDFWQPDWVKEQKE
jgi:uncharacterized protein YjbI with pentapeptide repeats